ncbi:SprT-like domain-containing protein [Eleftheria terrae]|uniref:SprT-like domain-containing protein n=1 Tax=Eleftheria terrae TaxID=1597781 RepID=UPI00263B1A67|nr:SprT-like domain-containing protein [Eleftheria terrae]WKB50502.1 SprT-like domain-containing protein [Eleftheria terrae]
MAHGTGVAGQEGTVTPTSQAYDELERAYRFYNRELFDGRLPDCLITLQRKGKRTMGYFAPDRFAHRDGLLSDELAMNPMHFARVDLVEVLQTLVHEMTHAQQKHFGRPSRAGYHNREWADMMKAIGLYPSSTGAPGGKEVGDKMADYVITGGRFEQATKRLLAEGFAVSWRDAVAVAAHGDDEEAKPPKDRSNRVKYTCPDCGLNAWGKPDIQLMCGKCRLDLQRADRSFARDL